MTENSIAPQTSALLLELERLNTALQEEYAPFSSRNALEIYFLAMAVVNVYLQTYSTLGESLTRKVVNEFIEHSSANLMARMRNGDFSAIQGASIERFQEYAPMIVQADGDPMAIASLLAAVDAHARVDRDGLARTLSGLSVFREISQSALSVHDCVTA